MITFLRKLLGLRTRAEREQLRVERVAEMSAPYEAYAEANDVLEDPDLRLRYSNENDYLTVQ